MLAKPSPRTSALVGALAIAFLSVAAPTHAAVDADAAQALAKKSNCMKCHSVTAKKDGPAFKETATKLKGKPDAEEELYKHLTTHPKVKVDGKEEEHTSPKTTNEAEIRNLVQWILAQ